MEVLVCDGKFAGKKATVLGYYWEGSKDQKYQWFDGQDIPEGSGLHKHYVIVPRISGGTPQPALVREESVQVLTSSF